MIFVNNNQDSAFIDPGMELDWLDLDSLTTWKTYKVTLTDLIDRMGAVNGRGIFSTHSEMEYELALVSNAKVFQTPVRGPLKNQEETFQLDWTPFVPQISGGAAIEDLAVHGLAIAVDSIEMVIFLNKDRLKAFMTIPNWRRMCWSKCLMLKLQVLLVALVCAQMGRLVKSLQLSGLLSPT
jgi:hypothetical protein